MSLTPLGYQAPNTTEIVDSMSASAQSAYGALIDVSTNSALGNFIGVNAIEIGLIYEDLVEFYTNLNPSISEGRMLENISLMGGIIRKGLTESTGVVTFTGTVGTIIPVGTVLFVTGDSSRKFLTDSQETISSDGTARVRVTSEVTGSISAPAGTLANLETPITGITSVTNTRDVSVGTDVVESDAALRTRRNNTLSLGGNGTPAAIRSALSQIDGVTTVRIITNVTSKWVEKGNTGLYRPPKSLEAIIENGDEDDITEALALTVSATSETFGELTTFYTDITGNQHILRWSRPSIVEFYIDVKYTLYDEETFPEDGEAKIATEIVNWALVEYQLGVDILVDRINCPIFGVSGIKNVDITVGYTGSNLGPADIPIELYEKASIPIQNITVSLN